MRLPAHLADATEAELAALVPSSVMDKAAAVVWHDGPLEKYHTVYGGAEMRKSGRLRCTSGFSVEGNDADGVLTAGHCTNNLTYRNPNGTEYTTTFEDDYDGSYGDFQWHTTSSIEDNRIYTSNTGLRNITAYEDDYGDLYAGKQVCMYGRSSNDHFCAEIEFLYVNGPVQLGRVAMDSNSAEPGDSGAPWYAGGTAYGVHRSECHIGLGSYDCWSSVAYLEDALDVTVMTG